MQILSRIYKSLIVIIATTAAEHPTFLHIEQKTEDIMNFFIMS